MEKDRPLSDAWLAVISEMNGELVRPLGKPEAVDPQAIKRLIQYLLPEARKVSPVATMFMALAVREIEKSQAIDDGCVLPFRRN